MTAYYHCQSAQYLTIKPAGVELPSPQSFKFTSLYSLKDLGLEAGASQDKAVPTICLAGYQQAAEPPEAVSLGSPQLSLQEKGQVVNFFIPCACSLSFRL